MEWPHQWGRFLKLASVKRVKAACVCLFIIFFFHYFKYYGKNVFSKTRVLYLIAKVERKEELLYLKHEIILYQKEEKKNVSG